MAGVRIGYAIGDAATAKKMAAYKIPWSIVNTFGVAATRLTRGSAAHQGRARATGGARLHREARPTWAAPRPTRRPTSPHRIGKTIDRRAFRDACAARGSWSGAISRRSKRPGRASPSARWKKCRRPPTCSAASQAVDDEPRRRRGKPLPSHDATSSRRSASAPARRSPAVSGAAAVKTACPGLGLRREPRGGRKGMICIGSNENLVGPGKKVLDGLRDLLEGGKKPGRYRPGRRLTDRSARTSRSRPNVLSAKDRPRSFAPRPRSFTSKTKSLGRHHPDLRGCAGYAELIGNPVRGVKLSSEFKIDLDPMLQASKGAGLVFYCNPNNPAPPSAPRRRAIPRS